MIVTASSIPLAIILKNTINALSACLSVLTSLVGLIFMVTKPPLRIVDSYTAYLCLRCNN